MSTTNYTAADLKNYKIAVLCGGKSGEREISLMSGECIFQALQEKQLDVTKIDPLEYDLTNLKRDGFTLVFNTLHGRFGEDGKVQGFLEVMGLKQTGCTVLQSALTLDKNLTKLVWKSKNIPVAPDFLLSSEQILAQQVDLQQILDTLGLPLFVKPNLEGSSLGVTKVKSAEQLEQALGAAAKLDRSVIVEKFINGREFSVPVLNGKALPATEIIVSKNFEYYDYEAKYFSDETQYACPPVLTAKQTQELQQLAEQAAQAIGIKSWCRVDILSDADGKFYPLEVNTNPGMTTHSIFPMGAKQVGMSFADLCLQVLVNAINDVENN